MQDAYAVLRAMRCNPEPPRLTLDCFGALRLAMTTRVRHPAPKMLTATYLPDSSRIFAWILAMPAIQRS